MGGLRFIGYSWVRCRRRSLRGLLHTLLNAFQISPYALFGIADGIRKFDLREIMSIKTLNIALVCGGHSLLGLDDFQIIRHSGAEAILLLT